MVTLPNDLVEGNIKFQKKKKIGPAYFVSVVTQTCHLQNKYKLL